MLYDIILMNSGDFLSAASLVLNLMGAVFLAMPLLRVKQDLDDDLIIQDTSEMVKGKEKYSYTTKGFLKDRRYGLRGIGLIGLGVLIQFILVVW